MRYALLGNSGLRVSELALGTMTSGTDWARGGVLLASADCTLGGLSGRLDLPPGRSRHG